MHVAVLYAQVSSIRGLPLEATKVKTEFREGEPFSRTSRIARSSNGSVYEETRDSRTGEIVMVHVIDPAGQRAISLDVKHKFYFIQPFTLSSIPNAPSPEDLQKYIDSLKTLRPTHTSENGYETESTPLRFRTQDGFLEVGRRTELETLPPSSGLKERVWEDWTIPALAVTAENIGFGANGKPELTVKLTNIQTTEPDPRLFEIPAGYIPRPAPSRP